LTLATTPCPRLGSLPSTPSGPRSPPQPTSPTPRLPTTPPPAPARSAPVRPTRLAWDPSASATAPTRSPSARPSLDNRLSPPPLVFRSRATRSTPGPGPTRLFQVRPPGFNRLARLGRLHPSRRVWCGWRLGALACVPSRRTGFSGPVLASPVRADGCRVTCIVYIRAAFSFFFTKPARVRALWVRLCLPFSLPLPFVPCRTVPRPSCHFVTGSVCSPLSLLSVHSPNQLLSHQLPRSTMRRSSACNARPCLYPLAWAARRSECAKKRGLL